LEDVVRLLREFLTLAKEKAEVSNEIERIRCEVYRFFMEQFSRSHLELGEIPENFFIEIKIPDSENPKTILVIENSFVVSNWEFQVKIEPGPMLYDKYKSLNLKNGTTRALLEIEAYVTLLENLDKVRRELNHLVEQKKAELEKVREILEKTKEMTAKILVAKKLKEE